MANTQTRVLVAACTFQEGEKKGDAHSENRGLVSLVEGGQSRCPQDRLVINSSYQVDVVTGKDAALQCVKERTTRHPFFLAAQEIRTHTRHLLSTLPTIVSAS